MKLTKKEFNTSLAVYVFWYAFFVLMITANATKSFTEDFYSVSTIPIFIISTIPSIFGALSVTVNRITIFCDRKLKNILFKIVIFVFMFSLIMFWTIKHASGTSMGNFYDIMCYILGSYIMSTISVFIAYLLNSWINTTKK